MVKKEEKKKDVEEKLVPVEKADTEADEKTGDTQSPGASELKETQSISELSDPQKDTEQANIETSKVTMEPVDVPAEKSDAIPVIGTTPEASSIQSETLPIDQIASEKPTQETYPLADEIEKDALKKKSFFSSFLIFRNKKGKIILLILVILLLIGLGVGTVLNANNEKLSFMKNRGKTREVVTLAPTQAPTPTPTSVAVDKESLKIQVQNGNGESGVAGIMKDLLVEKGYTGTIETGNADNYDYLETVVKVKKTKISAEKDLRADISQDYTVAEKSEELEEDSEYDAIVIIGAE